LPQLRLLEQEADNIILRTDKFYFCAIIIPNYAKHYLHPRIRRPDEVKGALSDLLSAIYQLFIEYFNIK